MMALLAEWARVVRRGFYIATWVCESRKQILRFARLRMTDAEGASPAYLSS
jgi:hypothetical protein